MANPEVRPGRALGWIVAVLLAIALAAYFLGWLTGKGPSAPSPAASAYMPPPGFEEEPKGPKVDVTLPHEGLKGAEAAKQPSAEPAP